MPVVDFRELTIAADPSSRVDFTTTATSTHGTLTVAADPSSKVDLTKALSIVRFGTLTVGVDGSTKLDFTKTTGSRFGTLTLVADGSMKLNAVAGPRRMGPSTIAGIPISGQIWPRANAGV